MNLRSALIYLKPYTVNTRYMHGAPYCLDTTHAWSPIPLKHDICIEHDIAWARRMHATIDLATAGPLLQQELRPAPCNAAVCAQQVYIATHLCLDEGWSPSKNPCVRRGLICYMQPMGPRSDQDESWDTTRWTLATDRNKRQHQRR